MHYDWLIVGLGNVGERYALTRHNIGFLVAQALCEKHNATLRAGKGDWYEAAILLNEKPQQKKAQTEPQTNLQTEPRTDSPETNEEREDGAPSALVILPTTYMNNSGKAARQAASMFRIPAQRIVAVVDEYNFPVGRIHLKNSGSDGGHNGTASMIEEVGTANFLRLRCGIDKKFGPGELVDYVLKPFAPEELEQRDAMIAKSVAALELLMRTGIARAMQMINADKISY